MVYGSYVPRLQAIASLTPKLATHKLSAARVQWLYHGFRELDGEFDLVSYEFTPWGGDFNLVPKQRQDNTNAYYTFEYRTNYWRFSGGKKENILLFGISQLDLREVDGKVLSDSKVPWHYIFLESQEQGGCKYSQCLPRDIIPSAWWGRSSADLREPVLPTAMMQPFLSRQESSYQTAKMAENIVLQHPTSDIPLFERASITSGASTMQFTLAVCYVRTSLTLCTLT